MTEQTQFAESDWKARIEDVLAKDPTFLQKNPELLLQLNLPNCHVGNVVDFTSCLIEKIREEIKQKQTIRADLLASLKNDQKIYRALKTIWPQLIEKTPEEAIDLLLNFICNQYQAERITLFIFARKSSIKNADKRKCVVLDKNHKLRDMFSSLFSQRKPLCDSLQQEHLDMLFGKERGATLARSILAPFSSEEVDFLLALEEPKIKIENPALQFSHLILLSGILSTLFIYLEKNK